MNKQPFSFFHWIRNDEERARELFHRWLRFASWLTRDSVLAADLVQDCILRIGRKPLEAEPENLYRYGTTVIHRLFVNRYKQLQRYREKESCIRVSLYDIGRTEAADDWAMLGGLVDHIEGAALSIPHLDVFLDRFLGMSHEQLARKYGTTNDAIRKRLSRTRRALRALLREIEHV